MALYTVAINRMGRRLLEMKHEAMEMLTRTTDRVERAAITRVRNRLEEAAAACDVERCGLCGLGTPESCPHDGCGVVACRECMGEAHEAIYRTEDAARRCPKAPQLEPQGYDGPPESDVEF